MADLDGLWERIRGGDRRAARELVDHLIIEGDEEQVQAASRAIGRHFDREARDLLRRAHMVEGESRRSLTAEALEALTTAAVATRLPELIRASLASPGAPAAGADLPVPYLAPVTNLAAKGVNGGIKLTWTPSATSLPVTAQEVIVYRNSEIIQPSVVLAPTAVTYQVNGLTNGASYVLVVNTLSSGVLPSPTQVNGTAGLVRSELAATTDLTATPAHRSLTFKWTDPDTVGATITSYELVLTGEDLPHKATVQAASGAADRSHPFTDLQNGTVYTLALQTIGTVGDATNQLGQTAMLSAIPGVTGTPFVPRVPALTADPLLFFDPQILGEIASAENLRAEALSIAQKWRYEYLKQKAVEAAQEALAYDGQIVELMSMALQKGLAAETQLTPVILAAIKEIKDDVQQIADVAKAGAVEEAIESLGDAITSSVLLTAILEWMARNDALDVWIGLFDALIDDACDFDKSLTRTKRFFDKQYESSAFGSAVKEIAKLQLARIGPVVEEAVRPLRAAVAELIGATSKQMGKAFAAFDLPILLIDGGTVDVPNVNPLLGSLDTLADAVDKLEFQLTKAIREELESVAEGNNKALFRSFMIAYFVTPILVALAVSMSGGPAAAAIIAGVIAISAEALLHLVARWILGPLQDPVEALEAKVAKAFRAVQKAIGNEAPLTTLRAPQDPLKLLEDELRLIRTLLPRAFVEDLAALLAEARTLTLSSGLLHALAAERALGYDHATAFDRILQSYASSFTPASLLPGGSDDGLFSGAALLRDLKRLDQDLIRMTDGRDVEITRRLSLFQLLGGIGDPMNATGTALGRFADFLRTGQAAVEIRPETLLDPVSPGMYRPIVEGVSVIGLARAPVVSALAMATGLSVTVSHSGRSSMRVRRDANASAPPIALPAGLVDETSYILATTYLSGTDFPFAPNSLEAKVWSVIHDIPASGTWDIIRTACIRKLPQAVAELANVLAIKPVSATALTQQSGHPPADAIDDDRTTYYASTKSAGSIPQWITVDLGASYAAITGARLWPRSDLAGWPNERDWRLEVAEEETPTTFRRVQQMRRVAVGGLAREAIYVQFAPISGRYVRLYAEKLPRWPDGRHDFEVADIQVVAMNVTAIDVPFTRTASGSATLASHDWNRMVDRDPLTYASSVFFGQSAVPTGGPTCKASLVEQSWINRLRFRPPPGTNGDFPSEFKMSLIVSSTQGLGYDGKAGPQGDRPVDFHYPSIQIEEFELEATRLPLVTPPNAPVAQYALQIGEVSAAVFFPHQPILSTAPIEEAVTAILRAWPTPAVTPSVEAAVVSLMAVLRDGVPAAAVRGLADIGNTPGASRAAYQTARNEFLSHVAKWAGARWIEDSDPNIHGLGFVQLEQTVAPGAAMFDLFPADDAATGTTVLLRPADSRTAGEKIYAPLQNLGLGSVLQIEAPGAAAALIADIILEIRMRACYDPQLATTVRANQQQRSQQIDRMVDLGAKVSRVLQLGSPAVTTSLTPPQSAQFSLRTNRDRILQAAIAGAQVQAGTVDVTGAQSIDGLTFVAGAADVAPLPLGAPFSYFGDPKPTTIALVFTRNSSTTLGEQIGKIVITPDVLGVDLTLLNALTDTDVVPMLTDLAVAIIPTRRGVDMHPVAGDVSDLLGPLLPEAWTSRSTNAVPLPRLSMTTPVQSAAKSVPLASLWPAAGGDDFVVTVNVGSMIAEGQLYDIIFSVTSNVPLVAGQTTSTNFF